MRELDPSKDISSLETFQSFIEDFRSRILEAPPHTKPFPHKIPPDPTNPAIHIKESDPDHKKIIRKALEGRVFIENIPWDRIPEGLMRILSVQYEAAKLGEDKKVDVQIGPRNLRFFLKSAHSQGNIDLQGKYYTPGLILKINSSELEDEVDQIFGEKQVSEGDFVVNKRALSTQERFNSLLQAAQKRALTEEEKEFLQRATFDNSWRKVEVIPSPLVVLQDIAKVLSEQKGKAFIYSD